MPQITAGEIFQWAVKRLQIVKKQILASSNTTPVEHAVEFRQALMVAFLISCPVRQRALLAMSVTGHVEFSGDEIFLNFRVEDMKDKKPRRIPLHGDLKCLMVEYLDVHRRVLLGGTESDMLWITARGNAYDADSFSKYLAIYTKRHFGEAFRAHKFRHIAATHIAEEMPERVGIIKDVLGHSTLRTAEKHYNRATALSAGRKLNALTAKYKLPKKGKKK